jgi:uncharacterized membrane protein YhiD involved in acid resistance
VVPSVGVAAGARAYFLAATGTQITLLAMWPLHILVGRLNLQGGQLIRLELNLKKLGALAGVSTVLLSHHVEMVTVASEKSKVAYRMEIELRLPNESSAHSVLSDLETLPGEEVRMVNSAEEA